ncbi:MED14-domain-containing protein [Rickenella mellea]|uniref:Mediator of RNA polymerase II transcription subunit 14 n=1 Tax=Rickenella mellea TaxID=50990 RepID=A0A4Y7Q4J6_9AGAM|nr:MED14-domain-containing protein [Rickenella mellea]
MPHEVQILGTEQEPSLEELERELHIVDDGQIPLGELLSRVMQSIYAELTEMAETLPNASDAARKRTLADWVVKTKKQVVKLIAVMKWSRDAASVQKAMNITAFLMDQNRQFEDVINGITFVKESLAPARLRNHDLLTSLDVLTTGSYLRLPTIIKKIFIPPTPLTDEEVAQTLRDMEALIRFRLRMSEVLPIEMSRYHITDGRVHFAAPGLFQTSLCLRGAQKEDGWFFVDVKFLHNVGGESTEIQEFPREPSSIMKRHIADEADGRLGYYLPLPADALPPPEVEVPPRPQLPLGTVDAPLVRLFNFLQMMSLSYQLEILFFQAQRIRALGWAEFLTLEKSPDSKSFTASYWIRPKPPGRPQPQQNRIPIPFAGGRLTVSIVELHASAKAGGGAARTPKDRVLFELLKRSRMGEGRPSDEVESLRLDVKWEPTKGALGEVIPKEEEVLGEGELEVDSQNLDFEALLRKAIAKHARSLLTVYQFKLRHHPQWHAVFSPPGEVEIVSENDSVVLRVHLCAEEMVIVSIDPRTGRLALRDTGDLAAAGRGPRFAIISDRINDYPPVIYDALVRLRYNTITEVVEQKASYLGLQCFRTRNISREELAKCGPDARAHLFIQLANFPRHYLVLVITDQEFRYALISVQILADTPQANMVMEDIGWLDVQRIHGGNISIRERDHSDAHGKGMNVPRAESFRLETEVLRELYAYCCARVSYTKVELQLKLRGIPYTHVNPTPRDWSGSDTRSALAQAVPALCVQSRDILAGAPAAEAAMPNIRVIPLNWWARKSSQQVVTCVKLKYVQQPVGKRAGARGAGSVIRPSKRIIYDTREAVVSFLSENVDTCVDEFLEEWARVSKMVVIAREVAQMSKRKGWDDVRLLSFDLQTVEFAYAMDFTVSITTYTDPAVPSSSSYALSFGRASSTTNMPSNTNPHADAEPFLSRILHHAHLAPSLHELVSVLRDSLPVALALDTIAHSHDESLARQNAVAMVDTFAKAAGWWRVLYGDLRHALDFRLMRNRRVAIIDAAFALVQNVPAAGRPSTSTSATPAKPTTTQAPNATASSSTDAVSIVSTTTKPQPKSRLGVLQPILGFRDLANEALKEAATILSSFPSTPGNAGSLDRVAQIDVGIICSVDVVQTVAQCLHKRVLSRLMEADQSAQRP